MYAVSMKWEGDYVFIIYICRSLLQYTIPSFAWNDRGKSRKPLR
jgi:hypothetical protein